MEMELYRNGPFFPNTTFSMDTAHRINYYNPKIELSLHFPCNYPPSLHGIWHLLCCNVTSLYEFMSLSSKIPFEIWEMRHKILNATFLPWIRILKSFLYPPEGQALNQFLKHSPCHVKPGVQQGLRGWSSPLGTCFNLDSNLAVWCSDTVANYLPRALKAHDRHHNGLV